MENPSNKIYENINQLYDKAGYLQRYGTDILIVVIIVILVLIGLSYFSFMNQIKPIKANWIQERCNPKYMPFAGLINKKDDQSILEATSENFEECSQTILQNISSYAMAPIYYATHIITEIFNDVNSGINSARGMFNNVRNSVTDVGDNVYNRSLNIMIPFQEYFIAIKSALGKVTGIAVSSIYTLYGSYLALKSLIGAIIEVVIIIMIALAAMIVLLWILPFTWPVAASMTAVFFAVLIPLIVLTVMMQDVFKTTVSGNIPKPPGACFDKNTFIEFENGTSKQIYQLNKSDLGKILKGGHKLTSIFKFDKDNNKMYYIDNIIISGSHRIFYNNEYIRISDYPNKLEIKDYDEPYIYCLNTDTGKIEIDNNLFLDYDDLTDEDLYKLKNHALWLNLNENNKLNNSELEKKQIYKDFIGGFEGFTQIEMNNGTCKFISECNVGDILKDNIKVLGVVLVDSNISDRFLYNDLFIASGNIIKVKHCNNDHNQIFSRLNDNLKQNVQNKDLYLYHLITDKQVIPINNEYFGDFNSSLDVPLNFYLH